MMLLRTPALALLVVVATQSLCSQARWVTFGEVMMTQPDDKTPSTYLLIQEQPVAEQPIAIVDAWETVDSSLDRFWSSILSPVQPQHEVLSERVINPFSWMAQQLAAIDNSQRAAFAAFTGGIEPRSYAREAYQQQNVDDSSSSLEQMLRRVGCSRFRPAMEQYGRQQISYGVDAIEDPEVVSLSSLLRPRKDSDYDESYMDEEDYAEDYAESLDVPFDIEAEYEDSQQWQGPFDLQPQNGQSSVLSGLINTLASLLGDTSDQRPVAGRSNEEAYLPQVDDADKEVQMAEERLGDSIRQMNLAAQGSAAAGSDESFVSAMRTASSLGRIAADALQVEYLGAEDEAVQTADSSRDLADSVVDAIIKPVNAFSATLTWSREGGLVMEADTQPQHIEDAQATDAQSLDLDTIAASRQDAASQLADFMVQQQQQLAWRQQEQQRSAMQETERSSEVMLSQPLLLSDILRREQQQQQQALTTQAEVAPCFAERNLDSSLADEAASNDGKASTFTVSWSRNGGLVIESYDGQQQRAEVVRPSGADERSRKTTEAFSSADLDWAVFTPGYFEVDDLAWSWVDDEGNLNWGLVLLTLLVIATSVVAVAAVHSYLAMQLAACMAALRVRCDAPRRLVEPLLDEAVEDENPVWGYSHLPLDAVAGAKLMEDANGYSVEYGALYAQAQNGRK